MCILAKVFLALAILSSIPVCLFFTAVQCCFDTHVDIPEMQPYQQCLFSLLHIFQLLHHILLLVYLTAAIMCVGTSGLLVIFYHKFTITVLHCLSISARVFCNDEI